MGLHPDHAVLFPRLQDTESQFWLFGPPACSLRVPLSTNCSSLSPGSTSLPLRKLLGQHLPLLYYFLICKEQPVLTQTSISTSQAILVKISINCDYYLQVIHAILSVVKQAYKISHESLGTV